MYKHNSSYSSIGMTEKGQEKLSFLVWFTVVVVVVVVNFIKVSVVLAFYTQIGDTN